jgi:translation elongation factor EF-G
MTIRNAPLLLIAVNPKTDADRENLIRGIQRLTVDDPAFSYSTDQQTGGVIIGGKDERHLETIIDRLKRESGVEATVGKLQVAYKETGAALLEPVMRVEVVVPVEHAGDVSRNLISRHGHVQSNEDAGGNRVIRALVPLSQMFGYATDLRSRTRGRATFSQEFDSYQRVRIDPNTSDDDRSSQVGAPLKPVLPRLEDSIALPEPDDENDV